MLVAGCQENESCGKVLNFLERLDGGKEEEKGEEKERKKFTCHLCNIHMMLAVSPASPFVVSSLSSFLAHHPPKNNTNRKDKKQKQNTTLILFSANQTLFYEAGNSCRKSVLST